MSILTKLPNFNPQEWLTATPVDVLVISGKAKSLKGGAGSGFWEGPGQPRFAHADGSSSDREKFTENLLGSSRTAHGISDTSISTEKPHATLSSDDLVAQVKQNVDAAYNLTAASLGKDLSNPATVEKFVVDVNRTLNAGTTAPDSNLYRTWAGEKNEYTPPEKIQGELQQYYKDLSAKIKSGDDVVATAAWHEQTLNNIHPFADGIGRTTKAVSALMLMQAGHSLPTYPSRDEYYSHMNESVSKFTEFYRGLFSESATMNKKSLQQKIVERVDSLKGGQGSGNFGHAGRPGERGGSGEGGDGGKFGSIDKLPYDLPREHPHYGVNDTKGIFFKDGQWSPARLAAVHDPALKSYTDGVQKSATGNPILYMTGGGYGSGKSSLVDKFPESVGFPAKGMVARVDPDATKGFAPEYVKAASGDNPNPFAAEYVHEESSDIAKRGVNESLAKGYDVLYDTSGDTGVDKLAAKIESFREAGATQVIGNYAFPGSIKEAQARADYRAEHSEGLRRYVDPQLLANNHAEVSRVWMGLAERDSFDKLNLWSTAGPLGSPPTLIASAVGGKITVADQTQFDEFVRIGKVKAK